jgi:hypothetical protein
MEHQKPEPKPQPQAERAAYETPAVVYEAALEVRAGTPLRLPDLLGGLTDPAGLNKQK